MAMSEQSLTGLGPTAEAVLITVGGGALVIMGALLAVAGGML